jgi:hypothetical protein
MIWSIIALVLGSALLALGVQFALRVYKEPDCWFSSVLDTFIVSYCLVWTIFPGTGLVVVGIVSLL